MNALIEFGKILIPASVVLYAAYLLVRTFIQKEIEVGFDYDYDLTYYYCDGCDHRFFTYRTFVAYHFIKSKK